MKVVVPQQADRSTPTMEELRSCEAQLSKKAYPRAELSEILVQYNRALGQDSLAIEQAQRLAQDGTVCVVTGQQLGFMGGPTYTFLKAISCLLLAREIGAIPLFWVATEDHDIAEIDHAVQVDPRGNLEVFRLPFPESGKSVEDLALGRDHHQVIAAYWRALGMEESPEARVSAESTSYSAAMMQLLVHAFRGTGLVFVEPHLLRPLAQDVFLREVDDEVILGKALQHGSSRSPEPLLHLKAGPNLFYKDDSARRQRITSDTDGYRMGSAKWTREQLRQRIIDTPERFSSNVASRPVVQSALFPAVAYVGGPHELQYHRELEDYFAAHKVPMPLLIPRIQATFVTPETQEYLKALDLQPWEELPENWRSLVSDFADTSELFSLQLKKLIHEHFGDHLPDAQAEHESVHCTEAVRTRAQETQLRARKIPKHAVHTLRNLLHPRDNAQERVLSWWEFQAQSRENLVESMLARLNWREQGHHYLYL